MSGPRGAWAQANFNLTSTDTPHVAQNSTPVTILVNGQPQTVQPGAALTPAQYLAVTQVLTSGRQTIDVGNKGVATGGSFLLQQDVREQNAAVLIPNGVTALGNFTQNSLNLHSIDNFGQLYAYAFSGYHGATIIANSLTNQTGATISSVIPSSVVPLIGGIPQPKLDMTFVVNESFRNDGVISSSGRLAVNSPTFVNNGSIESADNFSASVGSVINTGSIVASSIQFQNRPGYDFGYDLGSIVSSGSMATTSPTGVINFSFSNLHIENTGVINGKVTASGQDALNIFSTSSLLLGNVASAYGAVNIVITNGTLEVAPGSVVSAPEGVLLQNKATIGNIIIGDGAKIEAVQSGTFAGDVAIVVGELPYMPERGVVPADIQLSESMAGMGLFGNGITIGGALPEVPFITARGRDVIFSSPNSSAITIGTGTSFSAIARTLHLSSLDLTDPKALALVQRFQNRGVIGGELVATPTGLSGSVEIDMSKVGVSRLNGWNIPENVSVTLIGTAKPANITVDLAEADVTPYGNIAGALDVRGSGDLTLFLYVDDKRWPSGNPECRFVISGNVSSEGGLDIGAHISTLDDPTGITVSGSIISGGLLRLQGSLITITDGASLIGDNIEIFGCDYQPLTVISNSGLIEATAGSITAGHRLGGTGTVLTGDGSGLWKAVTSVNFAGHMINQQPTYRTGGSFEFAADQKFLVSGPNGSVTLTAADDFVVINPGVTLDVASPNTSLTILNATLVNNGTIDLHNPKTSGSYIVLRSDVPSMIVNNNGSVDLSDYKIQMLNGASLHIIASGDIISSEATPIDATFSEGRGGNISLYAGYRLTAIDQTIDNAAGSVRPIRYGWIDKITGSNSSILLPKTTITTSGISAGTLVAAATGSINMGAIVALGTYPGRIDITARSVNIGSILVSGSSPLLTDGKVQISAGAPRASSTSINPESALPGHFATPVAGGSIRIGSLTAGDVFLSAGGPGSSISLPNVVSANSLDVDVPAGTLNLSSNYLTMVANGSNGNLSIRADALVYPDSAFSPVTFSAPNAVSLQGGLSSTISVGTWDLIPRTDGAAVQTYSALSPDGLTLASSVPGGNSEKLAESSLIPNLASGSIGAPFNAMGNTNATVQTFTSSISQLNGPNAKREDKNEQPGKGEKPDVLAMSPDSSSGGETDDFVVDTEVDQAVLTEVSISD